MPLKIYPCTPADIPRASIVEKAAFADDMFAPILFPGPFPADAGQKRVDEIIAMMEDDPTTVWLKVCCSQAHLGQYSFELEN